VKTLIIKIGATGDVLRTTTILNVIRGEVHWLTGDSNVVMLTGAPGITDCIPFSKRDDLRDRYYDLVINLEDTIEAALLLKEVRYEELFGAYINKHNKLIYTDNSKEWFDLSLISVYGKDKADQLKFENRHTYQEMIFKGLGYQFTGEQYFIPEPEETGLEGDIAIATQSGSVWPMKNWAYYEELQIRLMERSYKVNFLPLRNTLREHIGDIRNHRYLISGDSLPMHIALGSRIKCLTIFICTSPWEIYDYGVQKKVVSPHLKEYFYKRGFDPKATASISLSEVYDAVLNEFEQQ
jgi:ADP-heptose:LPS heptosyltransferase